MKKSILCLLLALSLCLCVIFASCKPEEEPETPVDDGSAQGQVHPIEDTTAAVNPQDPNEKVPGYTNRH